MEQQILLWLMTCCDLGPGASCPTTLQIIPILCCASSGAHLPSLPPLHACRQLPVASRRDFSLGAQLARCFLGLLVGFLWDGGTAATCHSSGCSDLNLVVGVGPKDN